MAHYRLRALAAAESPDGHGFIGVVNRDSDVYGLRVYEPRHEVSRCMHRLGESC